MTPAKIASTPPHHRHHHQYPTSSSAFERAHAYACLKQLHVRRIITFLQSMMKCYCHNTQKEAWRTKWCTLKFLHLMASMMAGIEDSFKLSKRSNQAPFQPKTTTELNKLFYIFKRIFLQHEENRYKHSVSRPIKTSKFPLQMQLARS